MTCPKCKEGEITKIVFKKGRRLAFLCEFCGTAWFESEDISESAGHPIQSLTKDDEMEYTFVNGEERDEDARPVMYPKFK